MKIKFTFLMILFCAFSFAQNEFITLWKPNNQSSTVVRVHKFHFQELVTIIQFIGKKKEIPLTMEL